MSVSSHHYGLDDRSIRVRAEKWDLTFMFVALATFIRQLRNYPMRLGAWALDRGYQQSQVGPSAQRRGLVNSADPAEVDQDIDTRELALAVGEHLGQRRSHPGQRPSLQAHGTHAVDGA